MLLNMLILIYCVLNVKNRLRRRRFLSRPATWNLFWFLFNIHLDRYANKLAEQRNKALSRNALHRGGSRRGYHRNRCTLARSIWPDSGGRENIAQVPSRPLQFRHGSMRGSRNNALKIQAARSVADLWPNPFYIAQVRTDDSSGL